MNFFHKYGTRSNEIQRAKREWYFRLLLVIAVILFFVVMFLVTRFRPRLDEEERSHLVESSEYLDPLTNPELVAMRAEVERARESLQESIREDTTSEKDFEALEGVIALQREILRTSGSEIAPKVDLDTLDELLTLRDGHYGTYLMNQSSQLEIKAQTLFEAGKNAEALVMLEEARNLQEKINTSYARSPNRNPARLHVLANRLLAWETRPMAEEADALMGEAQQLLEKKAYQEAKNKMREALQKQRALNENYRKSPDASTHRLKTFETLWEQIETAEERHQIQELLTEASELLKQGAAEAALKKAERAELVQQRLLQTFPNSDLFRGHPMRSILILKETAASTSAYQEVVQLAEKSRQTLRSKDLDSLKSVLSEWLRATRSFQRQFPMSDLASKIDPVEVEYLHAHRSEVPALLETIYPQLVPVPGSQSLLMYRTEVPQGLYEKIMGQNPSNQPGALKPVDSAAWQEALEFTRFLSWILARPVQLPDRESYLQAVGETNRSNLQSEVWSSQNSDRKTQPVGSLDANPFGFHDLLGNVSEWLRPADPDKSHGGTVTAIGGSARESLERLRDIPEETRNPSERNRFIGFRFVVEMEDKAP